MTKTQNDKIFSEILIKWYQDFKRDLPWRNTNDPYLIWISEVILQQTRVDQGMDYYLRFINRFPNIQSLAKAEENEVLILWQGLGYYSRARNLHFAAKQLMSEFNGIFPDKFEQVKKLKGIGEYTAAAICSFAFNKPHAVVDGNVYRVLSRVFGISSAIDTNLGKKEFNSLANNLLNKDLPSIHNQAIMEFGALQCTPSNPNCKICPLETKCCAFNNNNIANYPSKAKKNKTKKRFFSYLQISTEDGIALTKRTKKDIWQHLYEFPLIETTEALNIDQLINSDIFKALFEKKETVLITSPKKTYKHILSHQHIYAQFFKISVKELCNYSDKLDLIIVKDLQQHPISRLIEIYLEEEGMK